MSPERLCWLGAKSLAVRIMLKGNRDEKISWAENVENVQMFPAAVIVSSSCSINSYTKEGSGGGGGWGGGGGAQLKSRAQY